MNPPYPCLNVVPDGFCPYTPTYRARECTSGVSWWASQYTGKPFPIGWGDALNFPTRARLAGFVVNGAPAMNSIMCIPPNHNGAGSMGHVAFVTGPLRNGTVPVIEMNFLVKYGYDFRNEAPVQWCQFIHLVGKPLPPDPPSTGEPRMVLYQRKSGATYQVAGASLIPLGNGADITYALSKGAQLYLESAITVAWASVLNALPVL